MSSQDQYDKLFEMLDLLCEGESDRIALMATIACELHWTFELFDWVGFYRNVGGEVVLKQKVLPETEPVADVVARHPQLVLACLCLPGLACHGGPVGVVRR